MIIKIIISLISDNSTEAVVAGTVLFGFYIQTGIYICNQFDQCHQHKLSLEQ